MFFCGVVLSILILGIAAAHLGRLLTRWAAGFAIATGAISLIAGGAALGAPLIRRYVRNPNIKKGSGPGGAFLYGLFYTVATATTGAGPLLLVLTVVAAVGRPTYGALLSLFYGIGRGLPFLLMGLFAGRIARWLAGIDRARRIAEVVSGVALVLMGVYFLRLATQLG